MKRALVLSGGGSRGAYEIGAWQALTELGVRFDAVYGTSIGALNAALVAQGDVQGAARLWQNVTVGQIVAVEDEDDFAIERLVSRKRDVLPFLMENARHLRMDITPLVNLVRENISEAMVRAGGMELGVMTCAAPQLVGVPVRLRDMAPGTLGDWIIASASCFPVFPAKSIGAQLYIDGGYCDNLPIDMALADGMDEVVAVELHPDHTHPEYARLPWLTTIKPTGTLGGFLDFNPELLRRARRLGYQDAMKRWGRLMGFVYTFAPASSLSAASQARRFMDALARFDAEAARRSALRQGPPVNAPLLTELQAPVEARKLSWRDLYVRGLELCAQAMGFREDAVYDADTLIRRARDFCRAQTFAERFDDAGLEAVARRGERALLAFIYQRAAEEKPLPPESLRRLSQTPRPTAAALFLANTD